MAAPVFDSAHPLTPYLDSVCYSVPPKPFRKNPTPLHCTNMEEEFKYLVVQSGLLDEEFAGFSPLPFPLQSSEREDTEEWDWRVVVASLSLLTMASSSFLLLLSTLALVLFVTSGDSEDSSGAPSEDEDSTAEQTLTSLRSLLTSYASFTSSLATLLPLITISDHIDDRAPPTSTKFTSPSKRKGSFSLTASTEADSQAAQTLHQTTANLSSIRPLLEGLGDNDQLQLLQGMYGPESSHFEQRHTVRHHQDSTPSHDASPHSRKSQIRPLALSTRPNESVLSSSPSSPATSVRSLPMYDKRKTWSPAQLAALPSPPASAGNLQRQTFPFTMPSLWRERARGSLSPSSLSPSPHPMEPRSVKQQHGPSASLSVLSSPTSKAKLSPLRSAVLLDELNEEADFEADDILSELSSPSGGSRSISPLNPSEVQLSGPLKRSKSYTPTAKADGTPSFPVLQQTNTSALRRRRSASVLQNTSRSSSISSPLFQTVSFASASRAIAVPSISAPPSRMLKRRTSSQSLSSSITRKKPSIQSLLKGLLVEKRWTCSCLLALKWNIYPLNCLSSRSIPGSLISVLDDESDEVVIRGQRRSWIGVPSNSRTGVQRHKVYQEEVEEYWTNVQSVLDLIKMTFHEATFKFDAAIERIQEEKATLYQDTFSPSPKPSPVSRRRPALDSIFPPLPPLNPVDYEDSDPDRLAAGGAGTLSFAPTPLPSSRFSSHLSGVEESLKTAWDELSRLMSSSNEIQNESESEERVDVVLRLEALRDALGVAVRETERARGVLDFRFPTSSSAKPLGQQLDSESHRRDSSSGEEESILRTPLLPQFAELDAEIVVTGEQDGERMASRIVEEELGRDDVVEDLMKQREELWSYDSPLTGDAISTPASSSNSKKPSREERIALAKERRARQKAEQEGGKAGSREGQGWMPVVAELKDVIYLVGERRRRRGSVEEEAHDSACHAADDF